MPSLLDTRWHLTSDEIGEWIRTLRLLRQDVREKIQPFVDGPATGSDLAKMRVDVCEFIVRRLTPLLESYWQAASRTSRQNASYQYDFFFSPGYRPYGRNRVPLEVVGECQSQVRPDHLQHLLALGRHSRRDTAESSDLFTLAPWMHYVYEQTIGACKIGGFTDWFAQFDRVKISDSEDPLVAFVIQCRTDSENRGNSIMNCANGVARFEILQRSDAGGAFLLEEFERVLKTSLSSFSFLGKLNGGAAQLISSKEIVPYPPAYISRNGQWVKVDLANLPSDLTKQEHEELNRAKERFAGLFSAIFRASPPTDERLIQDETVRCISIELSNKTLISYPYYHVFLTDQDLSLEHKQSDGTTRIGSKLGTLNLFTNYPLCDVGLGLIRDTLESVYDSVRDAEVLTEYARVPYHHDSLVEKWVRAYCEPWHSNALEAQAEKPWDHDEINRLLDVKPYAYRICSDLLDGFRNLEDEDKRFLAKTLFQTEGTPIGDPPTTRRMYRRDPCKVKKPDTMRYFMADDISLMARSLKLGSHVRCVLGMEDYWFPPVIPGALFFLTVRNLFRVMEIDDAPPDELLFGSDKLSSWLIIKLSEAYCSAPRAHELRYNEKSRNGSADPVGGFSGAIWRVSRCYLDISQPAREAAEQVSLSMVPINLLGTPIQSWSDIHWDNYTVEFRWKNPEPLGDSL